MSKLYCSRLHENFLVYLFTKNRLFFMAHELFLFAHEFHEFTRITKRLDNGDLIGRTNFTNSIFSAALGIARTSSAVHSLARKFVKFVGKKSWTKTFLIKCDAKLRNSLTSRCTRILGKLTNIAISRYERTEIGVPPTNGSDPCEPLPLLWRIIDVRGDYLTNLF